MAEEITIRSLDNEVNKIRKYLDALKNTNKNWRINLNNLIVAVDLFFQRYDELKEQKK